MSDATHTQGPWGVNDLAANNANIYLTGLDGTKSPLGYIVQTATTPVAAMIESKADARLIAAAPDLLAALESLLALTELHIAERSKTPEEEDAFLSCPHILQARAEIAKAKETDQ